ncbi:hypothetical protein BGX33_002394, partial [Mortierella sp. NVP41]
VDETTRKEIAFLVEVLDRSGLLVAGYDAVIIGEDFQGLNNDPCEDAESYLEFQAEDFCVFGSIPKAEELAKSIEDLTSMKAVVLSTCAEEFQISDYDLEILLVNPESTIPRSLGLTKGDITPTDIIQLLREIHPL